MDVSEAKHVTQSQHKEKKKKQPSVLTHIRLKYMYVKLNYHAVKPRRQLSI